MANRKGNPGNRGGGRKSAYQERADAAFLWEIFTRPMDREEVRALLATGKYSIRDVFVSKAFAGNERFIELLVRKLFPDSVMVGGTDRTPVKLVTIAGYRGTDGKIHEVGGIPGPDEVR